MINAKPNLNGNSSKDFIDAALQLSQAIGKLEEALGNIRSNVFHGRNYQHEATMTYALSVQADDMERLHEADRTTIILQSLVTEIGKAGIDTDDGWTTG